MSASYLIQILRPRKTGAGKRLAQQWFDGLLKEMTDRFGGATSFVQVARRRAVARRKRNRARQHRCRRDKAAKLSRDYWRSLRERLERELSQEEIVIRAQEYISL